MAKRGRKPAIKTEDTTGSKMMPYSPDVEALSAVPTTEEPVTEDLNAEHVASDEETSEPTLEVSEESAQEEELIEPSEEDGKYSKLEERYKNLESKFGEQGQEVGRYRKFVDEYIQGQLQNQSPQQSQKKPESGEEMFERFVENPGQVLSGYKDEAKQEAIVEFQRMQKFQSEFDKLNSAHPDVNQIVNSQDFKDWATQNIPPEMLYLGDRNPSVASNILSQYKATSNVTNVQSQVAKEITTKRKMATRASGVSTSSKTNDSPVFKREQIMEWMKTGNPLYKKNETAIARAYAEGRVK